MFYFVLFILSIIIYYIFDKKGNNVKNNGWIGLSLMTLLLCVVAGCRDYGIGTDTLYYSGDYFYFSNHFTLIEVLNKDKIGEQLAVGYFLLNKLAISLYNDMSSPLFLTEFCILGGSLFVFKKFQHLYRFNYLLLIALYLFLYYNQTLNYMRQLCAVTFTFASYYSFIIKKYRQCLIWLFVAYLFHTSAVGGIIPIAIYCVANVEAKKKRKILVIIYLLALVVASLAFNALLVFMAGNGFLLDIYAERYGKDNNFGGDFSTSQVLYILIGYLLILISYKKNILTIKQNYLAFLLHTTNLVMVQMGLYAFFLFRIAFFIALPDLLYQVIILSSKKVNLLVRFVFVILTMLLWLNLYIIHNNCETFPYKSHILGFY